VLYRRLPAGERARAQRRVGKALAERAAEQAGADGPARALLPARLAGWRAAGARPGPGFRSRPASPGRGG
jgi:hypothetical protein